MLIYSFFTILVGLNLAVVVFEKQGFHLSWCAKTNFSQVSDSDDFRFGFSCLFAALVLIFIILVFGDRLEIH